MGWLFPISCLDIFFTLKFFYIFIFGHIIGSESLSFFFLFVCLFVCFVVTLTFKKESCYVLFVVSTHVYTLFQQFYPYYYVLYVNIIIIIIIIIIIFVFVSKLQICHFVVLLVVVLFSFFFKAESRSGWLGYFC